MELIMFVVLLIVRLLTVTVAVDAAEQTTDAEVRLRFGWHYLYGDASQTKVICTGDIVVVECLPRLEEKYDENELLYLTEPLSLLTTDEYGVKTVRNSSTKDAGYEAFRRSWSLRYQDSMNGKTFNHTCVYGQPPTVNGTVQLDNCTEVGQSDLSSATCFIRKSSTITVRYQTCTSDDPLKMVIWEQERLTLHCSGELDGAMLMWFFEGISLRRSAFGEYSFELREPATKDHSGVYSCFSYNHNTGYYNKRHFEVEVLPRLDVPDDLSIVDQQQNGLLVSWTSPVPYTDSVGRRRPRLVGVVHKIWYSPFVWNDAKKDIESFNWRQVNTTDGRNNVTLTDLEQSELYVVAVAISYGSNFVQSEKTAGLVVRNQANETFSLRRKIGEKLDFRCGPDKYKFLFDDNTTIAVRIYESLDDAEPIRVFMSPEMKQKLTLPWDASVYECNGYIFINDPEKETVNLNLGVSWQFRINVTLVEPDSSLPTLTNVRCTNQTFSSFSISWTSAPSTISAGQKVALFLNSDDSLTMFSANLTANSFRFDDLKEITSYDVMLVVDDGNKQGRPVERSCSTTTNVIEELIP